LGPIALCPAYLPPLAAGEIVATGTLTRAFPVAAGEEWTTELTGLPLEGAVFGSDQLPTPWMTLRQIAPQR
jgi:hypothetical protein